MKTLPELEKYARENFVPIIRKESGHFLQQKLKQLQPEKVLEIGTAIGYSGALILTATDCHLTTIEKDEKLFDIAKQTFKENDMTERAQTLLGDAKDVLPRLVQKGEKFDFIFLDGPKGQYIHYLPLCKDLLTDKGTLFVDNINHDGLVFSSQPLKHKNRTMIVNLRKFVSIIQNDPELQTEIVDIEDGIAICQKK